MTMMLRSIVVLICISFYSCICKLYVPLGNLKSQQDLKGDSSSVNIYFDRNGTIYPDFSIPDNELRKYCTSLSSYYSHNLNMFKKILKSYGIKEVNQFDHTELMILQDSIISRICIKIDKQSKEYDRINFLIHGFNKASFAVQSEKKYTTSDSDFIYVKDKIRDLANKKLFFVQIYWDGLFAKSLKKLKIWSYAQANSYYVGLELRKIIGRIDKNQITILTHSLGGNVATTCLFNDTSKLSKKVKYSYSYNNYKKLMFDSSYISPCTKDIKICMIAPAMPGTETFVDYFNRNCAATPGQDWYKFMVVYNTCDPVLMKFLGNYGAYHFGSTSLGVLTKEVRNVIDTFIKHPNYNKIDTLNFSFYKEGIPNKSHYFTNYADNYRFNKVVDFLYNN
jgi:hypothetical protein